MSNLFKIWFVLFVSLAMLTPTQSYAAGAKKPVKSSSKKPTKTPTKNPRKVTFKKTTKSTATTRRPNSRPVAPKAPAKFNTSQRRTKNASLKSKRSQSGKNLSKPRLSARTTANSASTDRRPVTSNAPLRTLPAKAAPVKKTSWFSKIFGSRNFYKSAKKKRPQASK